MDLLTTTEAPEFQGWFALGQGKASSITCSPEQTFSISGAFADCLPSDSIALATACEDNVLQYDNGGDNTCIAAASCITMTVAQTSPLGEPLATRFLCAENWFYDTIYREVPTSVTATITSSVPLTMSTTATRNTSATSTTTPTAATSASKPDDSAISGGAIAGIVIGCIAALALIAAFFLRNKIAACFGKRNSKGIYEAPGSPAPRQSSGLYEIGSSSGRSATLNNEVYEIGSSGPKEHHGVHEIGGSG
ncbi:hypothetical protein N7475_009491 [Penicillium sp. IBT 31633x]|nr:hypothetical protein N7475_009491 [Penicillium sp. IBT 31633x]